MALGWHNHVTPDGSFSPGKARVPSNKSWGERSKKAKTQAGHDLVKDITADAHLFLNLAAPRAEAADYRAFLFLSFRRVQAVETFRVFLLQLEGQVMENAHTVFHRLEDRKDHK